MENALESFLNAWQQVEIDRSHDSAMRLYLAYKQALETREMLHASTSRYTRPVLQDGEVVLELDYSRRDELVALARAIEENDRHIREIVEDIGKFVELNYGHAFRKHIADKLARVETRMRIERDWFESVKQSVMRASYGRATSLDEKRALEDAEKRFTNAISSLNAEKAELEDRIQKINGILSKYDKKA